MKNSYLRGLIAAPFTPMDKDGNVNLEPVERYVNHLVNSGINGAFVCGTTGESPSLTTWERKVVLEEWVRCSQGRLKIICHVGGNSLNQSVELASHAAETGADGIGAFSPSFFKPSTAKDLLSFLAPIAGAAPDLPFYYYHLPSMTGVQIPVIDLLSEAGAVIPNFAGVKFTHFDLYDMQQCIAYGDGEFEILHGYDEVLLAGLCLGVKGAVGSTYNYMPSVYLRLWDAYNHLEMEKARELQQFSVKVVRILNKYGGGVRAGKVIMGLIGIGCGPCRLPIQRFSDNELSDLEWDLNEIGFFDQVKKVQKINI